MYSLGLTEMRVAPQDLHAVPRRHRNGRRESPQLHPERRHHDHRDHRHDAGAGAVVQVPLLQGTRENPSLLRPELAAFVCFEAVQTAFSLQARGGRLLMASLLIKLHFIQVLSEAEGDAWNI